MKALRFLAARFASLRFLRSAIPFTACALLFAPMGFGTLQLKGWGFFFRLPDPVLRHGDDEISQVPGQPSFAFAPFSDPGGTSVSGQFNTSVLSLLS
jgi:hypothetical protein